MRGGILTIGLILLVLGVIFYFMPISTTQAEATTNGERQEVQASATVPIQFSAGAIIVGIILTLIGIFAPSSRTVEHEEPVTAYEREERVTDTDGTRRRTVKKRYKT